MNTKKNDTTNNDDTAIDFSVLYAAEVEKRETGVVIKFGDTSFKALGVVPSDLLNEMLALREGSDIDLLKSSTISLIVEDERESFAEFIKLFSTELLGKVFSDILEKVLGKAPDSST